MKVLQETTEWAESIPNHTYIVEQNKLLAYIKANTTEVIKFQKPMMFDKGKRKFTEIKNKAVIAEIQKQLD